MFIGNSIPEFTNVTITDNEAYRGGGLYFWEVPYSPYYEYSSGYDGDDNSYCVVFDTVIEDMPEKMFPNRPWGPGNNPKTAVREYLISHDEFEIDKSIHNKLLISVAHDGYLKRIK